MAACIIIQFLVQSLLRMFFLPVCGFAPSRTGDAMLDRRELIATRLQFGSQCYITTRWRIRFVRSMAPHKSRPSRRAGECNSATTREILMSTQLYSWNVMNDRRLVDG